MLENEELLHRGSARARKIASAAIDGQTRQSFPDGCKERVEAGTSAGIWRPPEGKDSSTWPRRLSRQQADSLWADGASGGFTARFKGCRV